MSIASATLRSTISRKPNYGIDSPGMVFGEAAIGTIARFAPSLFHASSATICSGPKLQLPWNSQLSQPPSLYTANPARW